MSTISQHTPDLDKQLLEVFRRARLPSSPQTATGILRLIDDPDSTIEQFAEQVQTDPALSARVLRVANSARYAQRRQVTTIDRAVTIIGLRQLRITVLGFELVNHLDRLAGKVFDLRRFWRDALIRASLGREVARDVVPERADEAFIIGLLQDCGILALIPIQGSAYARLMSEPIPPATQHQRERAEFPYTHVEAIRSLAFLWSLPEGIARPLGLHHEPVHLDPVSDADDKLAAVTYFVASLELATDGDGAKSDPGLRDYAYVELGYDPVSLKEMLERTARAFDSVTEMFSDKLDEGVDALELLLSANRRLQEEAEASEHRVKEVEAERDQIRGEQITLRQALGQYREQAAKDPLTGLLNRRALLDAAADCVRYAMGNGAPLAVGFIDLDNFKQLNDTHGHAVGDQVLKAASEAVRDLIDTRGATGRYGGEEIVVFIPDCPLDVAHETSERILHAIRCSTPDDKGLTDSTTGSLGIVWTLPHDGLTPEELIAAADEQMYIAKSRGKDTYCMAELGADGTQRMSA